MPRKPLTLSTNEDTVLGSEDEKMAVRSRSRFLPVVVVFGAIGTFYAAASILGSGVDRGEAGVAIIVGGSAFTIATAAMLLVSSLDCTHALRLVAQQTEESLRYRALHDSLTGLPNRSLITERVEQLLIRARAAGRSAALLFVDLDEFKSVNDTLGHLAGDQLLQQVGARLLVSLDEAHTIGRMGGDEFVVLLDGGPPDAPLNLAVRLLDAMRRPFELQIDDTPISISITCSVGIASGDRNGSRELLRDADFALYEAKAAGRNCFEVFSPEMEVALLHRYGLEFDLRPALDANQFRLAYQPIYNLDDLEIVGVEALLRWDHPRLGVVWPDEFIPLLETSGQIIDVGNWVLNEACAQMAEWRRRGLDLGVSINVSGRQLDRDIIVEDVRHAIESSGLDPSAVTIEVTETSLMRNTEKTAERLEAIKALGVKIAIDDFGTGYSSLAYLEQFQVDCLKIDKVFTDAITRSPESDALVHTLVQLARDLGLKTLAEGVETNEQVAHLRAEHVDQIQGFAFARPLDPRHIEALVFSPGAVDPNEVEHA